MKENIEKRRLAILRILRDAGASLSGKAITEELHDLGYETTPRTIRFHLKAMDEEGLTGYSEKHGRYITEKGIKELNAARVYAKVGYINARIDNLAWEMSFDIKKQTGTVIINISFIKKDILEKAVELILPAFEKKYAMGSLVRLYNEGEKIGNHVIPKGYAGLGTVCSFTLNGILINEGIPIQSLFGGLVEIESDEAVRFLEIIKYSGTSIDPLEIFLQSKMTNLKTLTQNGSGKIGANFFEIPSKARNQAVRIADRLKAIGLGNVIKIGHPEHPLLKIPINTGKTGGICIGGLNPIALLTENNIDVVSHAISDIVEYSSLYPYSDLFSKIQFFI